jgi:hypothetical protein
LQQVALFWPHGGFFAAKRIGVFSVIAHDGGGPTYERLRFDVVILPAQPQAEIGPNRLSPISATARKTFVQKATARTTKGSVFLSPQP